MNLMNLIMQLLGLIDLPRDFPSIRVISFIINLYLILVISVGKGAKKFCQKNLVGLTRFWIQSVDNIVRATIEGGY